MLIQLEGRQDTLQFWTQEEARIELQKQMLAAISDGIPGTATEPQLPPPPASKSSFFGKKSSKAPEVAKPVKVPVMVDVQLDEAHFRAENEYGLYETLRCRCLLVMVDVR